MSFGLICLLLITTIGTLVAFYILLQYQVEQAIEVGYMKNLNIRSTTMAALKQNDLEMIGNDLSVSAHIITDLVSRPEDFADETYLKNFEEFTHDGVSLTRFESKDCETNDGTIYKFFFKGDILQNGAQIKEWTVE